MNREDITIKQFSILTHTIGWERAVTDNMIKGIKNRKYEVYRNYYSANNDDIQTPNLFVEMGLMTMDAPADIPPNRSRNYRVSKDGLKWLSDIFGCSIVDNITEKGIPFLFDKDIK